MQNYLYSDRLKYAKRKGLRCHLKRIGYEFTYSRTNMEKLCERLDTYAQVVDILDGIRSHPNVSEDYEVIMKIIMQSREQINAIQSNLNESKQIIESQKAQSRALDSLLDRIKHISDNADFYSQFVSNDGEAGSPLSVTPEPGNRFAHSSPIFSEPTPSISRTASHTTIGASEVQQPQPPKTPKPVDTLDVAISYISNSDFATVPSYMKGRLRTDDVNSFITQFNAVLNQKTALLKKPRKTLKLKKEMDL
ncbi:hypothetical protein GE061_004405, partial [Apolygus lucorum]